MDLNAKIKFLDNLYPWLEENWQNCTICPRNCQVNRRKNKKGYCQSNKKAKFYNTFLHHGEEPPLSGKKGSGTIFFSGCNLKCAYCQNYKFSQLQKGKPVDKHRLAEIMLSLEKKGAENINLVTPSHFLLQILTALKIAFKKGLGLPLVYNSSGYEKKEVVKLIAPLIDCWLLDFKYFWPQTAQEYSNSPQYPDLVKKAALYLGRQKKSQINPKENQLPCLIIRHLALPGHVTESLKILNWIKEKIPNTPVSIMSQYQPYFQAKKYPKINRPLRLDEYNKIKKEAEKLELKGWLQEFNPQENLAGVYFKEK